MQGENPRSIFSYSGHPTHAALVSFPIAFLNGALVSDVLFWQLGDPFWARASFYLIGAGIVMALLAALAGFTDFLGDRRVRALGHAWQHMIGNLLAVGVAAANLVLRLADPAAAIMPTGLVLSAAVALILSFTGWLGGELVFHHRVGVANQPE